MVVECIVNGTFGVNRTGVVELIFSASDVLELGSRAVVEVLHFAACSGTASGVVFDPPAGLLDPSSKPFGSFVIVTSLLGIPIP